MIKRQNKINSALNLRLLDEQEELLYVLLDMVRAGVAKNEDGNFDSNFIGQNARALRLLAKHRVLEIIMDDGGRSVEAKIVDGYDD